MGVGAEASSCPMQTLAVQLLVSPGRDIVLQLSLGLGEPLLLLGPTLKGRQKS